MTQDKQWVSGGLVFLGTRQIDMTDTVQRVADALEAFGARVLGMRIGSATVGSLQTAHHDVQLTLHCDDSAVLHRGAAGVFMNVEITNRSPMQCTDAEPADILLVQLRRALHKAYAARPDEEAVTSQTQPDPPADYKAAETGRAGCGQVIPRLPCSRRSLLSRKCARSTSQSDFELQRRHLISQISHEQTWAHAPEDQYSLRNAMRAADPAEEVNPSEVDRIRLSAWLLSIAVALLCLPVGAALAVINLLRGENLRLASQTAALTGTFVALQATGAVAQAAHVIQAVLN